MSDDLKVILVLNSKQEAHIVTEMLKSGGIEATLRGAREYAGLYTGTEDGRYEILVESKNERAAKEVIRDISAMMTAEGAGPTERTPSQELKRAVIFAIIAAVVLPIIFNFASLNSLRKYIVGEPPSLSKYIWILVTLVLNFAVCIALYIIYNSFQGAG